MWSHCQYLITWPQWITSCKTHMTTLVLNALHLATLSFYFWDAREQGRSQIGIYRNAVLHRSNLRLKESSKVGDADEEIGSKNPQHPPPTIGDPAKSHLSRLLAHFYHPLFNSLHPDKRLSCRHRQQLEWCHQKPHPTLRCLIHHQCNHQILNPSPNHLWNPQTHQDQNSHDHH